MAKYILAYDLGTTGNKSTVFDLDGSVIDSIYYEYKTNYFGNNCAEQNPLDWWRAICESTKNMLNNSKLTKGVYAAEYALKNYSWANSIEKVIELYQI